MKVRLCPVYTPESFIEAKDVKCWAEIENVVLVAAYIRMYADKLASMKVDPIEGCRAFMSLDSAANMLDTIAWEIENNFAHERQGYLLSRRMTFDLLDKCFNGEGYDDRI